MTQGNKQSWFSEVSAHLTEILAPRLDAILAALQGQSQDQPQLAAILTELQSEKATKVQMFSVPMPLANIEYKWQLPFGTKKLSMQCRDSTDVYMATNRGCVAGPYDPYVTLKGGTAYDDQQLNIGNLADISTIYFGCASAGKVVEIIIWS
jgi:hypothetical protein